MKLTTADHPHPLPAPGRGDPRRCGSVEMGVVIRSTPFYHTVADERLYLAQQRILPSEARYE